MTYLCLTCLAQIYITSIAVNSSSLFIFIAEYSTLHVYPTVCVSISWLMDI